MVAPSIATRNGTYGCKGEARLLSILHIVIWRSASTRAGRSVR
ncbi:hypothetical protein [Altererythrobacter sp. MF3-039]